MATATAGKLPLAVETQIEETSPLLSQHRAKDPEQGTKEDRPGNFATAWILIAVIFLVSVGGQLQDVSALRILESIICYETWERDDPSKILIGRDHVGPGAIGGVHEALCKGDGVQGELAALRGYQQFFDGLIGLILAIPFGAAADRYGRRPLILLALGSFTVQMLWQQAVMWFWQTFAVKLVLLSALPALAGGSSTVLLSLLMVILSDITKPEDRAAIYLRFGAVNYVALLIAPLLVSWTMSLNPWVSNFGGTAGMASALLLAAISVPETLSPTPPSASASDSTGEVPEDGTAASTLKHWRQGLDEFTAIIFQDARVPVLVSSFLLHQLVGATSSLLLQYSSKRYDLTTATAVLLLEVLNGMKTVHCVLILPAISSLLVVRYTLSSQQKDLYLSRLSQLFVCIGWFIVGLAPNIGMISFGMVIVALGQGTYFLIRAFLTTLVPPEHLARLFSMVSLLDTIGYMLGGPILSRLYAAGLHAGGIWIGLPFQVIGLATLVYTLVFLLVPLHGREK